MKKSEEILNIKDDEIWAVNTPLSIHVTFNVGNSVVTP